ncbi:hypothetical protein M0812_23611 [Anaeramoeba flamelloides]|uniref:Uncharacterized protein n=1 Tax=Anaeramoeba flamelloides TaxID=1746091 RepID=A0AAV7YRM5_9EUKA|nr:hypothetical protein M0812_23611 [Anaeramoeba flamelloides]
MNKYSFSSELACQDLVKIQNDFKGVTSFSERLNKLQKWRPNCIKGLPPSYLRKDFVKDKNKAKLPTKVKIKRDCITDLVLLCSKGKKTIERGLATFFKKYFSLRNVSNYSREWLIFAPQKDFSKMKNNKTQQKLDEQQSQPKQLKKLKSSKRSKASNQRKRSTKSNKSKNKKNSNLSTNQQRDKLIITSQEKKSQDPKYQKKKKNFKSFGGFSSLEECPLKISRCEKSGKINFHKNMNGATQHYTSLHFKKEFPSGNTQKLNASLFDLQQKLEKKFQSQRRRHKRRFQKRKSKLLQEPIHKKPKHNSGKNTQRRKRFKKKIVLCNNYKKFLKEKEHLQRERDLKQEQKYEQKCEQKCEQKYEQKYEQKCEQKYEQTQGQEVKQEQLKLINDYENEEGQITSQIQDHTHLQLNQNQENVDAEDWYNFEKNDDQQNTLFKMGEPLEMFSIPILDSSPVSVQVDNSNQGLQFFLETDDLLTEEFPNLKNGFSPFMDDMFDDFDSNLIPFPNDGTQFGFD